MYAAAKPAMRLDTGQSVARGEEHTCTGAAGLGWSEGGLGFAGAAPSELQQSLKADGDDDPAIRSTRLAGRLRHVVHCCVSTEDRVGPSGEQLRLLSNDRISLPCPAVAKQLESMRSGDECLS